MRLAGILLMMLVAFAAPASAENIYLVQSETASRVYGGSIAREIKRLRPDLGIRVLHLRGFTTDRFPLSKRLTTDRISDRAENFDNLILLGYDLLDFHLARSEPLVIPLFVDTGHSSGPASLVSQLQAGETVRRQVPFVGSTYYVLSDTSSLSQYRLRQLETRVENDKSVDMEYITVRKVTDLRRALIDINARTVTPGVILNNLFDVPDDDTMQPMRNDDLSEIIADINTKHVEVGILRPELNESVGVGALATDLAQAILMEVDHPESGSPPLLLQDQIGVNLDRISQLGLNSFVLQNPTRISYVGANTYEH